MGEARETRKAAAWALSLALTWGKRVQDAMGMVLLPDIRVAHHLSRDTYSPCGLEPPGKQCICTSLLQVLSLLTDSLFSCLSPSYS